MFIDYYRIPNKAHCEDIIFTAFENIQKNPIEKENIQKRTIQELIKELDGDQDQEQAMYALRIEKNNSSKENLEQKFISRLNYQQELFTLLQHTNKEEESGITRKNNKIQMIYDIHNITKEGDIKNWIKIMEDYVNDGKISKEDIQYIREQVQNATGDFYEKRETDNKFSSILKTIEEEQDDSGSTIGDYVHITRNRVTHGIYHSIKQGDKLIKEIIQSMSEDEKKEAKNLLQQKRGADPIFTRFSDFDKRIEKELSEN